jgi:hypothetical protein
MKNNTLVSLLLGVSLLLLSCKTESINAKDTDKVIKFKETVSLSVASSATLTFAEVEDSRCPEGGQCIWAGNVIVDLVLKPANASASEVQNVKMCLGDCKTLDPQSGVRETDTTLVSLNGNRYTLTLLEVSPYPNLARPTVTKNDYTIKIKIEAAP